MTFFMDFPLNLDDTFRETDIYKLCEMWLVQLD